MKRALLFVALPITLFGCNMIYIGQSDEDYSTTTPDLSGLRVDQLAAWCQRNITYELNQDQYGVAEYWATPAETLRSRKGDCKGIALLFLYLVHRYYHEDGYLLGESQIADPSEAHMIAVVNGVEYFQYPPTSQWQEYKTWTYAQGMWIVVHTHGEGWFGRTVVMK